jgi:hypothetical protein
LRLFQGNCPDGLSKSKESLTQHCRSVAPLFAAGPPDKKCVFSLSFLCIRRQTKVTTEVRIRDPRCLRSCSVRPLNEVRHCYTPLALCIFLITLEITTVARLRQQLIQHLRAACTLNKTIQALLPTLFKISKFTQHNLLTTDQPTLLYIKHSSTQRNVPNNKYR